MSFSLSNVNGIQMQRDSVLSSLSVACDATTVLPKNNLLYQAPRDGKVAASVDVCNLEVANLQVSGTLAATNTQITNLSAVNVKGEIVATTGPLTITAAGDPTTAPAFGAVTANAMNVIIDIGVPTGVIPGATTFNLLAMGTASTTNGSNQLSFTLLNSKIQADSRIIATYDSVSGGGNFVPLFCVPVVSISQIQGPAVGSPGKCSISLCNAGSQDSGIVNLGKIHVAILNPYLT